MRVIVFTSLVNAQTARNILDTKLGFPCPGTKTSDGTTTPPGADGWTLTMFAVVSVVDTNGLYGPPGTTYYLLGPIWPALETRLSQLASPPTIVTVPNALLNSGTAYIPSISGWVNNLPTMIETPTPFVQQNPAP